MVLLYRVASHRCQEWVQLFLGGCGTLPREFASRKKYLIKKLLLKVRGRGGKDFYPSPPVALEASKGVAASINICKMYIPNKSIYLFIRVTIYCCIKLNCGLDFLEFFLILTGILRDKTIHYKMMYIQPQLCLQYELLVQMRNIG